MKYSSRLKKKTYSSVMGVLIEHREKRTEREQKGVKAAKNNFLTSFSDLICVNFSAQKEN